MDNELLSHYRKVNGTYCIDIAVSALDELLATHDPSPIHQRDLHGIITKRLKEEIIFFQSTDPVHVVFHLPRKLQKYESEIRNAFRHYFEFEYMDSGVHLARRVYKARKILGVAIVIFMSLIAASYIVEHYFPNHVIWHIVSESLFVGSWVALWHPVHLLLYEWIPLQEDRKTYGRLKALPIEFVYK
ncbi:MAG: hypothetical protein QS98_C0011G0016 [archaeon GW2011_AR3]|nr:MAG: hypothetical protein QS98_C0011G0016 [archaeon GW2011_AR3]MBS3109721.1 hypothetical protein [Candidatus Woesearchaeota archaeon]